MLLEVDAPGHRDAGHRGDNPTPAAAAGLPRPRGPPTIDRMFTPQDCPQMDPAPPIVLGAVAIRGTSTPATSAETQTGTESTSPERSASPAHERSGPGFVEVSLALAAPLVLGLAIRRGWHLPAAWPPRAAGVRSWAELLALGLALYLGLGLIALAAGALGRAVWPADTVAATGLAALITFGLLVPGALATLWLAGRGSASVHPGLRLRARDVPAGLAGFGLCVPVVVAASMAAVWVATLVRGTPPDPIAHDLLRTILDHRSSPWAWALIVGAVLGAPVVEEAIYRVLLQSALASAMARPRLAVLGTSLLFALAHAPPGAGVPPHALVSLFVLSCCLGLAYERTGRYTVPVVMHVCFNAANVALALGTL